MKDTLLALGVALLAAGCGGSEEAVNKDAKDDPSVPLAIPCMACGEQVSKVTEECRQCGHPTPASVVAYKEAQEEKREQAELERKRRFEAERSRLVEQQRKRLTAVDRRNRQIQASLNVAEAIDEENLSQEGGVIWKDQVYYTKGNRTLYSGWMKVMYDNGQIRGLIKSKKARGLGHLCFGTGTGRS